MKSTEKQNWFDDLIEDFVPTVPTCPQSPKQNWGQSKEPETRMDKSFNNSVPNVPTVPTKKGNTEKILSISRKQEATIKTWLTETGEPEADHFLALNKCKRDPEALAYFLRLAAEHGKAKRREKVLRMLEENPGTQRAFVTDTESDPDNVILTMAIRDQASFEMLIPRRKYDSFLLLAIIERTAVQ